MSLQWINQELRLLSLRYKALNATDTRPNAEIYHQLTISLICGLSLHFDAEFRAAVKATGTFKVCQELLEKKEHELLERFKDNPTKAHAATRHYHMAAQFFKMLDLESRTTTKRKIA